MQEVYFKNSPNYDGWKESLQNAKEGLDHMKGQYEKMYNEKPLIQEFQKERRIAEAHEKSVDIESKSNPRRGILQKSHSVEEKSESYSKHNTLQKSRSVDHIDDIGAMKKDTTFKEKIMDKVRGIFKNTDVAQYNSNENSGQTYGKSSIPNERQHGNNDRNMSI